MKSTNIIYIIGCLIVLSGCQKEYSNSASKDVQLSLSPSAQYQISISRTTTVDIKEDSDQSSPQVMTENLTATLSLQPIDAREGQITFKAVCDSVRMSRIDFVGTLTGKEGLRSLQGKEFTLTFSTEGDLLNDASLRKLMKPAAKNSLNRSCKGTLKESDMLTDFYDSVVELCASSAKRNYSDNENYTRYEPTPTPAVEFSLPDRKIVSTVNQITDGEGVKKAKISEIQTVAENTHAQSLNIYPHPVKTEGLFSGLRRWRTQSINGTGEKVVNLDTGVCELLDQHWQVKATASFAIPIRDTHPAIAIDETIRIKQIEQRKVPANYTPAKKLRNGFVG